MRISPARIPAEAIRPTTSFIYEPRGDAGEGIHIMSFVPFARRGLAAAVSILSAAAYAHEATLPPVVVSAARVPQPLADALPHTTVITNEQIRASGVLDVPSLLKREAGVEFTQNGGIGSSSGLFLRGTESRHVAVLVDGVRINSETVGATAVEHLPLEQIERIEIVRGNVSAIYGSGAIGGVVQIFTRGGQGAQGPNASLMAGSRGTAKLSAGYAGKSGDASFSVQAARSRTQGFSSVDTALYAGDNPDRDGYRNDSLSANYTQRLAAGHSVGLQVFGTEGRLDYDNGGNFGSPADVLEQTSKLSTLSVFSDNRFGPDWTARLQWSIGQEAARFASNGADAGRYRTRHHQLQWRHTIALSPERTVTAGVEADRQSIVSDSGFPPVLEKSRTLSSATVGYLARSGPHEWQANARHDRTADFGSATTGLLGYGIDLGTQWKLTALLSSAFTAPNLGQLYSPGFGNAALQAERAQSVELGLAYAVGADLLRLTAFKTRVRDQIDFDLSSFQYMNARRVRNAGLELSYTGRVAGVDWRASLTHQNPEDADTGRRLLRRARHFGSVAASYALGSWTLGADLYASASRPDAGRSLGGYAVLDLRAAYRFDKAWTALLKVENVTDRRYQTAYGYNQAPRGVYLTASWQP
jgi:vitamin B12 transporter